MWVFRVQWSRAPVQGVQGVAGLHQTSGTAEISWGLEPILPVEARAWVSRGSCGAFLSALGGCCPCPALLCLHLLVSACTGGLRAVLPAAQAAAATLPPHMLLERRGPRCVAPRWCQCLVPASQPRSGQGFLLGRRVQQREPGAASREGTLQPGDTSEVLYLK